MVKVIKRNPRTGRADRRSQARDGFLKNVSIADGVATCETHTGKTFVCDETTYLALKQEGRCIQSNKQGYFFFTRINQTTKKIEIRYVHQVALMNQIKRAQRKGEKKEIDHISRQKWDNRKENLELVSRSQNAMNRAQRNKKTGLFGVSYQHKKGLKNPLIRASAGSTTNKQNYLGYFQDLVSAGKAVDKAKVLKFGLEFVSKRGLLNYPADWIKKPGYFEPVVSIPNKET